MDRWEVHERPETRQLESWWRGRQTQGLMGKLIQDKNEAVIGCNHGTGQRIRTLRDVEDE